MPNVTVTMTVRQVSGKGTGVSLQLTAHDRQRIFDPRATIEHMPTIGASIGNPSLEFRAHPTKKVQIDSHQPHSEVKREGCRMSFANADELNFHKPDCVLLNVDVDDDDEERSRLSTPDVMKIARDCIDEVGFHHIHITRKANLTATRTALSTTLMTWMLTTLHSHQQRNRRHQRLQLHSHLLSLHTQRPLFTFHQPVTPRGSARSTVR